MESSVALARRRIYRRRSGSCWRSSPPRIGIPGIILGLVVVCLLSRSSIVDGFYWSSGLDVYRNSHQIGESHLYSRDNKGHLIHGRRRSASVASALADRDQLEGKGTKEEGGGAVLTNSKGIEKEDATARYVAECEMPTDRGSFRMRSYRCQGRFAALEPVALTYGSLKGKENVLARIHDQCLTSEVFGSKRCDCKEQLGMALDMIRREGGVVIYLQQEGRGIGLANKVAAYALQDQGLDTVDANRHLGFGDDERTYDVVPSILEDLGVRSIQLMTNNPLKLEWVQSLGIKVNRLVPIVVEPNAYNQQYLLTKAQRMAHILPSHSQAAGQQAASSSFQSLGAKLLSRRPATGGGGGAAVGGSGRKWRAGEATSSSSTSSATSSSSSAAAAAVANQQKINDDDDWQFDRATVEKALNNLKQGKPIVLIDPKSSSAAAAGGQEEMIRGDLVVSASKADVSAMEIFAKASSGITYALLSLEHLAELWTNSGGGPAATAAGLDYRFPAAEMKKISGSSAKGRAATLQALARPQVSLTDFTSPGHIFVVAPGAAIGTGGPGLLESPITLRRAWALEMVGLAVEDDDESSKTSSSNSKSPASAAAVAGVSEIVDRKTGELMDLKNLKAFAKSEGLVLTSVDDVARYCLASSPSSSTASSSAED